VANLFDKFGEEEPDVRVSTPPQTNNLFEDFGEPTIRNGKSGWLVGTEFIPDKDSADFGDVSIDDVVVIPGAGPFEITQKGEEDKRKPSFPPTPEQRLTAGIGVGATKLVGGFGQLAAGIGERTGIAPAGQTKRVSDAQDFLIRQIEEATGVKKEDPAVQLVSVATQASPFLKRIPLNKASLAKPAGVTKGVIEGITSGAVLGSAVSIEGEEEPLSGERLGSTLFGAGAGGALPFFFGLGGAFKGRVTGEGARREAIEGLSAEDVRAAEFLQSKGFTVTPGGAMDKLAKLSEEGNIQIEDIHLKLAAERAAEENAALVAREIEDVSRSLLPEGDEFESLRGELYRQAYNEPVQRITAAHQEILMKHNNLLEGAMEIIAKDPVWGPRFEAFPNGSVGRLDIVKKAIDRKISSQEAKAEGGDALAIGVRNSLQELRSTIRDMAVKNSDAYRQATDMSSRAIVLNNINKKLKAAELDDMSEVNPFDFYTKVLKSKENVEDIFGDLSRLKNRAIAEDTKGKVVAVRELLRSLQPTQKSLLSLAETKGVPIPERGVVQQQVAIWMKRIVEGNHNEDILEFILNPTWSKGALKEIQKLPLRQRAVAFGTMMGRVGAGGGQTFKTSGMPSPEEQFREPTEEEIAEREFIRSGARRADRLFPAAGLQ
jgi:hypothetical protein